MLQNDALQGGAGDDHLHGGEGRDLLTGGGEADTFVIDADGVVSSTLAATARSTTSS